MMKRMICTLLIALLVIGLLPGCGAEEEVKPVSSANKGNFNDNVAVEEDTTTESKASEKITIEEAVVYEKDGVKITVSGIEDGWTGPEVKFLEENTTDKNIALSGDTAVINGVIIFLRTVKQFCNLRMLPLKTSTKQIFIATAAQILILHFRYRKARHSTACNTI